MLLSLRIDVGRLDGRLLMSSFFIGTRTILLAAEEGLGHALFSTAHGQSPANELADLSSEFLGLYLGGKTRQLITGEVPVHGLGGKIVGTSAPELYGRLPIAGA